MLSILSLMNPYMCVIDSLVDVFHRYKIIIIYNDYNFG